MTCTVDASPRNTSGFPSGNERTIRCSTSRWETLSGEKEWRRTERISHSGNASINYPLYLAAHPTVELTTSGNLPAPDKSRLRRPTPSMICPIFPKVGSGPLGGVARRPAPAPSALEHSLPDPDILSLNYTNSLREQLRLVNQRIDDVCKTLRTKDECGKSPLCGSPFVQEIQDAPIPPHFRLSMLEAYDSSSDPMEHMATFHRANQYVAVEILVAEKREDQKRPRAELSRGTPPGRQGG
ncbi:hypothetical protein BHE74_00040536 [Ensete ventricosum]|nr:hypothetical protein BHE74_00040536 [Ensete ventricosum]